MSVFSLCVCVCLCFLPINAHHRQLAAQRKTNVELRVRTVRFDAELQNVRETEHLTAQVEIERLRTRVLFQH